MKKTCFQATAMVSLILSFLILSSSHVGAEFLDLACSSAKGSYTANSSFENNLKLLLQTLPFSTPLTGFNNTSVGEVFGQALCRGDVNSTVCQSCVEEGSHKLLKECKTTDAIIWYDSCHVRYSFQNFFSMNVYTGKYPEKSGTYKEIDASDLVRFRKALDCLMTNLTNGAAFDPSKRMFATGEVKFSENSTIYGLLQCTRDISGEDCNSCLSYALAELKGCCNFRQGGIIVSRNCNVRFEMNRFYNAPSNSIICTTKTGGKKKTWMVNLIAAGVPILALAILFGSFVVHLRKKRRNGEDDEKSEKALMQEQASSTELTITQVNDMVISEDLPFMNLSAIQAATNNFCHTNKLGQGGFGPVYKGLLADGKEIAAKRLSKKSWQGLEEFKNEIVLISKLQHRNLVRLLGCAIEGDEKLLVYEFMPNKSLDMWIFDSKRRKQLDWKTLYSIIGGIAKGLLYLHEDSRLKIIHRDLKASNVLLDHEMVAKISDFGMARIFGENQNTANTRRVVGTYGYMAPEYAMEGLFSVKSDAFSFGVILLEILSGRRNSGFHLTEHAQTLLAYVWRLWNEGRELEFVDPLLVEGGPTEEIVRCIHVGLLCVQEDPADRPTMSSVVVLLGLGDEPISPPQPKQPAFYLCRVAPIHESSAADPSGNNITVSSISPR